MQPADELRIQTTLDQAEYKPGGEARVGFRVTNNRGEGVQAALGLEIVDRAVFALADKQPGFAKLFFYLEQEIMKPRQQIHSVTLPEVISSAEPSESSRRDRAARALFSAMELPPPAIPLVEFGRDLPRNNYRQYAARYETRLRAQLDKLAGARGNTPASDSETCDQDTLGARLRDAGLRDAWGNSLRIDEKSSGARLFGVRSAGPDGQFYTADDLVQYREDRYCTGPVIRGSGAITLKFQHDELAPGALAEITGVVLDASGATIPGASIRLLETATGKVRVLSPARKVASIRLPSSAVATIYRFRRPDSPRRRAILCCGNATTPFFPWF